MSGHVRRTARGGFLLASRREDSEVIGTGTQKKLDNGGPEPAPPRTHLAV